MTETFEHGYALLIGVGDCQDSRLSLPVTVKDTQAIKKVLIDSNSCGYLESHINILNNEEATKEGLLAGLEWLKDRAENDSEATIFIYYSGHGGLKDDKYYLIPHDYVYSEDNPLTTALSSAELTNALRKIDAKRLLVVIDSCHAAGMATSKDEDISKAKAKLQKALQDLKLVVPSEDLIKVLTQGEGRAVFTSCEGEEKSWIKKDHSLSIYTCHFLEALKGKGNKAGDTEVKIDDLMGHLDDTVSKTTRQEYNEQQTPYFDLNGNNFVIAKLQNSNLPSFEDIIYVERSPLEENACQQILKSGSLLKIQAPKKMGKTWFKNYVTQYAKNQVYKVITYDCNNTDQTHLNNSENYRKFLRELCTELVKRSNLYDDTVEENLKNDWNIGTPNALVGDCIKKYLLDKIDENLVIVLENVDIVLETLICDEFCRFIRALNEKPTKNYTNSDIWEKLHLIIVYSTDVYASSKSINYSPLEGVGESYVLPEFTKEQVEQFFQNLNNAKIMQDLQTGSLNRNEIYPIAVAIPFSNTPNFISQYILAGVAQRQDEFNKISPWRLLVLMANDYNNGAKAQKIAEEIGKIKPILAVIGHYSSSTTAHVINKYNELKINQIASTSTATRERLKKNYKKYLDQNSSSKLDFSFFFRVTPTTKEAMEEVFKYIDNNKKNLENVIIFYDDTDVFSYSSFKEAEKEINKRKNLTIKEEILLKYNTPLDLKNKIKNFKNDSSLNSENTIILLLNNAYKDITLTKPQDIIKTNKGHFLIIGNNSIYDPQIINNLDWESWHKLIIATPWFPSNSSEDKQKIQKFDDFWGLPINDSISRFARTYDATKMFTQAISKLIDQGKIPTLEGVNDTLLSTDFEGMTGRITISKEGENKGDRQNASFDLMKPECPNNNHNDCEWRLEFP